MSFRNASLLLTALLWLGLHHAPAAHDSRPITLTIDQTGADRYRLIADFPESLETRAQPGIRIPPPCRANGLAQRSAGRSIQLFDCNESPGVIGNGVLELDYPGANPSLSTLVRINWDSGEVRTLLAGPKETKIALPDPEQPSKIAGQYFLSGIIHILEGVDHLLFLACLLLIAGRARRILIMVTGFTVAHSITLAAAALGWVTFPSPPVEAAIALSILLLATEIARPRRDTLTWRHPVAVSSSFGLVHGLGFAGVLSDVGLPQTEIPLALLMFNVGVEVGQLLFIVAATTVFVLISAVLRRLKLDEAGLRSTLRAFMAYGVGTIAATTLFFHLAAFTSS